jgi:PEP-CTERM motif
MDMRRCIIAGVIVIAGLIGLARPAAATEIGSFYWDPFNSYFALANFADYSDPAIPDLQLLGAQVLFNGSVFDLGITDPLDPTNVIHAVSPGEVATTASFADGGTFDFASAPAELIFGATPTNLGGLLTVTYFDSFGAPASALTDVFGYGSIDYTPVPEPGTLALFAIGLATAAVARRRRRHPSR